MDLGPILDIAGEIAFDNAPLSVNIVVVPLQGLPVTTRGIWDRSIEEDTPVGRDFNRREPRRVMAIRRTDCPEVPRGTVITAPERDGSELRNWQIDGVESTEPDHIRYLLVPRTK